MSEKLSHQPTPENMARTPWTISRRPSYEPGRRSMPWQALDCDGAVVGHFASSHAALIAARGATVDAEARS